MTLRFLYRGDSDSNGIRMLKETIDHGQLQTNLINGGFGRTILEEPLLQLINLHVGTGWKDTHFLSFSESERTAFRFGFRCQEFELQTKIDNCSEVEDGTIWNFAIITLDLETTQVKQLSKGVHECLFRPTLRKFAMVEFYKLILVNVREALMASPMHALYSQSIENATRDLEWLVLPATPVDFEHGQREFSAILDGGCISNVRKFFYE